MKALIVLVALLVATPAYALETYERMAVQQCADMDEAESYLKSIGERLVLTGKHPDKREVVFLSVNPESNEATIFIGRENKDMKSGIEACLVWYGKIQPTE